MNAAQYNNILFWLNLILFGVSWVFAVLAFIILRASMREPRQ